MATKWGSLSIRERIQAMNKTLDILEEKQRSSSPKSELALKFSTSEETSPSSSTDVKGEDSSSLNKKADRTSLTTTTGGGNTPGRSSVVDIWRSRENASPKVEESKAASVPVKSIPAPADVKGKSSHDEEKKESSDSGKSSTSLSQSRSARDMWSKRVTKNSPAGLPSSLPSLPPKAVAAENSQSSTSGSSVDRKSTLVRNDLTPRQKQPLAEPADFTIVPAKESHITVPKRSRMAALWEHRNAEQTTTGESSTAEEVEVKERRRSLHDPSASTSPEQRKDFLEHRSKLRVTCTTSPETVVSQGSTGTSKRSRVTEIWERNRQNVSKKPAAATPNENIESNASKPSSSPGTNMVEKRTDVWKNRENQTSGSPTLISDDSRASTSVTKYISVQHELLRAQKQAISPPTPFLEDKTSKSKTTASKNLASSPQTVVPHTTDRTNVSSAIREKFEIPSQKPSSPPFLALADQQPDRRKSASIREKFETQSQKPSSSPSTSLTEDTTRAKAASVRERFEIQSQKPSSSPSPVFTDKPNRATAATIREKFELQSQKPSSSPSPSLTEDPPRAQAASIREKFEIQSQKSSSSPSPALTDEPDRATAASIREKFEIQSQKSSPAVADKFESPKTMSIREKYELRSQKPSSSSPPPNLVDEPEKPKAASVTNREKYESRSQKPPLMHPPTTPANEQRRPKAAVIQEGRGIQEESESISHKTKDFWAAKPFSSSKGDSEQQVTEIESRRSKVADIRDSIESQASVDRTVFVRRSVEGKNESPSSSISVATEELTKPNKAAFWENRRSQASDCSSKKSEASRPKLQRTSSAPPIANEPEKRELSAFRKTADTLPRESSCTKSMTTSSLKNGQVESSKISEKQATRAQTWKRPKAADGVAKKITRDLTPAEKEAPPSVATRASPTVPSRPGTVADTWKMKVNAQAPKRSSAEEKNAERNGSDPKTTVNYVGPRATLTNQKTNDTNSDERKDCNASRKRSSLADRWTSRISSNTELEGGGDDIDSDYISEFKDDDNTTIASSVNTLGKHTNVVGIWKLKEVARFSEHDVLDARNQQCNALSKETGTRLTEKFESIAFTNHTTNHSEVEERVNKNTSRRFGAATGKWAGRGCVLSENEKSCGQYDSDVVCESLGDDDTTIASSVFTRGSIVDRWNLRMKDVSSNKPLKELPTQVASQESCSVDGRCTSVPTQVEVAPSPTPVATRWHQLAKAIVSKPCMENVVSSNPQLPGNPLIVSRNDILAKESSTELISPAAEPSAIKSRVSCESASTELISPAAEPSAIKSRVSCESAAANGSPSCHSSYRKAAEQWIKVASEQQTLQKDVCLKKAVVTKNEIQSSNTESDNKEIVVSNSHTTNAKGRAVYENKDALESSSTSKPERSSGEGISNESLPTPGAISIVSSVESRGATEKCGHITKSLSLTVSRSQEPLGDANVSHYASNANDSPNISTFSLVERSGETFEGNNDPDESTQQSKKITNTPLPSSRVNDKASTSKRRNATLPLSRLRNVVNAETVEAAQPVEVVESDKSGNALQGKKSPSRQAFSLKHYSRKMLETRENSDGAGSSASEQCTVTADVPTMDESRNKKADQDLIGSEASETLEATRLRQPLVLGTATYKTAALKLTAVDQPSKEDKVSGERCSLSIDAKDHLLQSVDSNVQGRVVSDKCGAADEAVPPHPRGEFESEEVDEEQSDSKSEPSKIIHSWNDCVHQTKTMPTSPRVSRDPPIPFHDADPAPIHPSPKGSPGVVRSSKSSAFNAWSSHAQPVEESKESGTRKRATRKQNREFINLGRRHREQTISLKGSAENTECKIDGCGDPVEPPPTKTSTTAVQVNSQVVIKKPFLLSENKVLQTRSKSGSSSPEADVTNMLSEIRESGLGNASAQSQTNVSELAPAVSRVKQKTTLMVQATSPKETVSGGTNGTVNNIKGTSSRRHLPSPLVRRQRKNPLKQALAATPNLSDIAEVLSEDTAGSEPLSPSSRQLSTKKRGLQAQRRKLKNGKEKDGEIESANLTRVAEEVPDVLQGTKRADDNFESVLDEMVQTIEDENAVADDSAGLRGPAESTPRRTAALPGMPTRRAASFNTPPRISVPCTPTAPRNSAPSDYAPFRPAEAVASWLADKSRVQTMPPSVPKKETYTKVVTALSPDISISECDFSFLSDSNSVQSGMTSILSGGSLSNRAEKLLAERKRISRQSTPITSQNEKLLSRHKVPEIDGASNEKPQQPIVHPQPDEAAQGMEFSSASRSRGSVGTVERPRLETRYNVASRFLESSQSSVLQDYEHRGPASIQPQGSAEQTIESLGSSYHSAGSATDESALDTNMTTSRNRPIRTRKARRNLGSPSNTTVASEQFLAENAAHFTAFQSACRRFTFRDIASDWAGEFKMLGIDPATFATKVNGKIANCVSETKKTKGCQNFIGFEEEDVAIEVEFMEDDSNSIEDDDDDDDCSTVDEPSDRRPGMCAPLGVQVEQHVKL